MLIFFADDSVDSVTFSGAYVVAISSAGTLVDIIDIAELIETKFSNVIVRPTPGTLHALPWAAQGKYRIGEVLCETFWMPPYRLSLIHI